MKTNKLLNRLQERNETIKLRDKIASGIFADKDGWTKEDVLAALDRKIRSLKQLARLIKHTRLDKSQGG